MDIKKILDQFLKAEDRNIIILDDSGRLLYESTVMDLPAAYVIDKINSVSEEFEDQEFYDRDHDMYFNLKKTVIEDEGKEYSCFRMTDESEYALLIKEVASYTKNISNMSKFQTSIMNKLSMAYDTFIPGLAEYCGADEVIMLMKNKGNVVCSTYSSKTLQRTNVCDPDIYSRYFSRKRGSYEDGTLCILNSAVHGYECVVLVKRNGKEGASDPMDASVHNVISLFIENSILRDKIVYESEHDKLTGLFNKGKYMALKKTCFGRPDTIAIYNFDVNNLKHINDNYGHEYGDALIIKAAKSIAAVSGGNVYGFRMGGDEYAMIAADITSEGAEELRTRWKAALDRLNDEDRRLFCSMACGVSFGSGDYDYDELFSKADELMYENKKALKSQNITSHIVSEEEIS